MNTVDTPQLLGHPKGLFYLFFAEMWERFSFYGMRALLTLYMVNYLQYTDEISFGVFAAYGSLVYATPLIGGLLSDKILGLRKAIVLGAVLMAIGHFVLAIDHPIFFYGALGLLIVGNGFFKPNISTFVGSLYEEGDNRRESGFTIFYLGINIGGMIAPLLCGWLGYTYGWHYGFGLAGIGMIIGLVTFLRGVKSGIFADQGKVPNPEFYYKKTFGLNKGRWITTLAFLSVPFISLLVKFNQYEHFLLYIITAGIFYMLIKIYKESNKTDKSRLLVIVYFTMLSTLFFTFFEQGGSSLTLFAQRNVNLTFLNASQTNSINSFFIIVLALIFSWLWSYLSKINRNPNSPIKFGLGLFFLGSGFLVFALSARSADQMAHTPMIYLLVGYFIYTLGEMFISPIGLSKMTELASKKYLAFLMGIWFLSSFYGHYFAGKIAKLTAVSNGTPSPLSEGVMGKIIRSITHLSPDLIKDMDNQFPQLYAYTSVFTTLGVTAILVGIIAMLLSPFIKKMMKGIH